MILAGLCFTLMLACVKVLRADLSALEVVFWRGAASAPLAALAAWGRPRTIHNRPVMALRVLAGLGAMLCYYSAAGGLPLADLTLLTRLEPLLIAFLAPVLLGRAEQTGRRGWGLLLLGLLGCAIVIAPQLSAGSRTAEASLWALAAMLLSCGAHLCLRVLGATEDARVLVMWMQVAITLLAGGMLLAFQPTALVLPALPLWPWLLGVGAFATAGQILATRAYALERASIVAAATHTAPLWAILLDVVAFQTLPTAAALLGGALILAAALGLVLRRSVYSPP